MGRVIRVKLPDKKEKQYRIPEDVMLINQISAAHIQPFHDSYRYLYRWEVPLDGRSSDPYLYVLIDEKFVKLDLTVADLPKNTCFE